MRQSIKFVSEFKNEVYCTTCGWSRPYREWGSANKYRVCPSCRAGLQRLPIQVELKGESFLFGLIQKPVLQRVIGKKFGAKRASSV